MPVRSRSSASKRASQPLPSRAHARAARRPRRGARRGCSPASRVCGGGASTSVARDRAPRRSGSGSSVGGQPREQRRCARRRGPCRARPTRAERRRERGQVARARRARADPSGQPLEVAHAGERRRAARRASVDVLDQRLDRVEALADRGGIEQRRQHPLAQAARAHRRRGLVEHPEQRAAALAAERLAAARGSAASPRRARGDPPSAYELRRAAGAPAAGDRRASTYASAPPAARAASGGSAAPTSRRRRAARPSPTAVRPGEARRRRRAADRPASSSSRGASRSSSSAGRGPAVDLGRRGTRRSAKSMVASPNRVPPSRASAASRLGAPGSRLSSSRMVPGVMTRTTSRSRSFCPAPGSPCSQIATACPAPRSRVDVRLRRVRREAAQRHLVRRRRGCAP